MIPWLHAETDPLPEARLALERLTAADRRIGDDVR